MNIRPAKQEDLESVAELHAESIKTGFLSQLGTSFLKELYRAIGKQPGACVLVAESDGKVNGFIAGTIDTGNLYKSMLAKNWYRFFIPLVRFILNPIAVYKITETLLYGLRQGRSTLKQEIYNAELLSISVHASTRGKGTGKALIQELETFFHSKGISGYKVVTFAHDQRSNKFYKSCTFSHHTQFIHHGNTMNEYVKMIV